MVSDSPPFLVDFDGLPNWGRPLQRLAMRMRLLAVNFLQHQGTSPPRKYDFVLHAWTWHHLAIKRDLARLSQVLDTRINTFCPATESGRKHGSGMSQRQNVVEALNFILEGWGIHNSVERTLFFPWLQKRAAAGSGALAALGAERQRLEGASLALAKRLDVWAGSPCPSAGACRREARSIGRKLRTLRADALSLFDTAEATLVPRVAAVCPPADQRALNRRIVGALGPRAVRLTIVTFQEALFGGGRFAVATPADRANFRREVPPPVRALVPLWRRGYLKPILSFLAS